MRKSKPKPRPPDEVCSRCGKLITGQMIANLWKTQVVCTPCYRWHESEMATEPQLAYATVLGFDQVNADMTKADVSRLISIGAGEIDRLSEVDAETSELLSRLKEEGRSEDAKKMMRALTVEPLMRSRARLQK